MFITNFNRRRPFQAYSRKSRRVLPEFQQSSPVQNVKRRLLFEYPEIGDYDVHLSGMNGKLLRGAVITPDSYLSLSNKARGIVLGVNLCFERLWMTF